MLWKTNFKLAQHIAAISCFYAASLVAAEHATPSSPSGHSPLPLQLEVAVPYEPTAFASDNKQRLVYELLVRNFERQTLDLQELTVLDPADPHSSPLAVFKTSQLQTLIKPLGAPSQESSSVTTLASGGSAMIYLLLTFDSAPPAHLQHRLRTSKGELLTGTIGTRHDVLQVLGAPVTGSGWLAETGLSNDNGHRRGNLLQHGQSHISRRYAFDWVQVDADGAMYSGDEKNNTSYSGYGEPVVAVSDAKVVAVTDNIPANTPKSKPAVEITLATIPGNSVTLDIGDGYYAHYMHLQPGSLRVKAGEQVKRGQVLGLLGNSGDSFAPHLHFEITTSPVTLAGEGVPYVIETFGAVDMATGNTIQHKAELPLEKTLVDFGK